MGNKDTPDRLVKFGGGATCKSEIVRMGGTSKEQLVRTKQIVHRYFLPDFHAANMIDAKHGNPRVSICSSVAAHVTWPQDPY